MSTTTLERQRKLADEFHAKWKARGGKMTTYTCQHCKTAIETRRPRKGDVDRKGYWDTAMTCANCGRLNFVVTYPSGRTIAAKIP